MDGHYARKDYPERLRRIRYNDAETGKALVFLTNHFELPALTIAALYRNRWQVELFFNGIQRTWYVRFFSIGLANAKHRNGLASAFASSSGWCDVGGGRATRGWCHASVAVPRTTVYQRRCGLRSLRFYGIKNPDFGPTPAAEKLLEIDGTKVSRETISQFQVAIGRWKLKSRRVRRVFQLRDRRPRFGELIQIDGSPHDCFEAAALAARLSCSSMMRRAV